MCHNICCVIASWYELGIEPEVHYGRRDERNGPEHPADAKARITKGDNMRVSYRARKNRRGTETVYEQTGKVRCCCDGMRRAWGELIVFGVKGHACTTSKDVSLCIPRPQADGGIVWEVVPVVFCPWCGEAIEACRRKYGTIQ